MSDQENHVTETVVACENSSMPSTDQNQSSENTEKVKANASTVTEQRSTPRILMPQDIRYATEHSDREKLMKKYNNYQVSDTNACNVRFLIDNRQKKLLFGQNEEENSNIQALAKTCHVNIYPGYQQPSKHSYKIFGTEANVRQCLIEIMNRMFKRTNRSSQRVRNETDKSTTVTTTGTENTQETETTKDKEVDDKSDNPSSTTEENKSVTEQTEASTENQTADDKSVPQSTSIFVTTINPDASMTEEKKDITPITPNTNEENNEQEHLKFIPLERKPHYTFIMLISSQGQEVLKKNWNFFAGSLQQRLNVIVTNPVKLPKFGDKQIQNELSITGESIENLTNTCLQITAFINDVLGVPIQPYKYDETSTTTTPNDNSPYQRTKTDKYNHRSSPAQYQGQSSSPSFNNHQGRIFFNRNRSGIFEQIIHIRSDCVPRIVGKGASNLKRIQNKCHLRDMIVGRQANENGYVECTLTAYQARNLHFAIDTIRSCLKNEDATAVIIMESNHTDNSTQESPHLHELVPPSNSEKSSIVSSELLQSGFLTKHVNSYPQPSYNFQNTPSFDFTHQATSAARKTDKRRGDLNDQNKTPNQQYETFPPSSNYSSNSPKHKSKRSCPETKEIDCTTDDGFWIQKQYYHALDDTSKQLFDSLIDKLEQIRIETEENVARKHQRLVGRNRSNKSRVYTSSISYLNEDKNQNENNLMIKSTQIENNTKLDQTNDVNEEKENKQETSAVIVNQD